MNPTGRLTCFLAALMIVGAALSRAGELAPSGKAIMDEWDGRNRLQDEITEGMTEIHKKFKLMGKMRTFDQKRRTTTWTLRYGENNLATVLRYHSPEDLENLSVLSYKDLKAYSKPYVVWQWEPDNNLLRQMSGPLSQTPKNNYFAVTDFTYEDLELEDLDSCVYRHVRDEKLKHAHDKKLSGTDCYVVEAYKKQGHKTGYAKRVLWISKDRYLTVRIDFYRTPKPKEVFKTLWAWDFKEVLPGIWRSDTIRMERQDRDCWTKMTTRTRRANPGIPAWFFQPNVLKITDEKGVALIEEMWSDYREIKKLEEEVEAARKELGALRKKTGGAAAGGTP